MNMENLENNHYTMFNFQFVYNQIDLLKFQQFQSDKKIVKLESTIQTLLNYKNNNEAAKLTHKSEENVDTVVSRNGRFFLPPTKACKRHVTCLLTHKKCMSVSARRLGFLLVATYVDDREIAARHCNSDARPQRDHY